MRYQLRPYQHEAVERARRAIAAGKRRPLIVAPTGSDKTVIASHIVESAVAKARRTLFLAHRIELIEQASGKLDEIGIEHGIIKSGHSRARPELSVQVASVQTLSRRVGDRLDYQLIIVDEAHHVTAASYRKVLDAAPQAVALGLTATPYRADRAALGEVFDELIEVISLPELIEGGHLVEPRVFGRKPPDLTRVRTTAGDYNLGQLATVMDTEELVSDLVTTWMERAAGRTTVAFAVNIEHSQHIAAAFARAGVAAGHVDGTMSEHERGQVLRRLARGELQVVANCAILTEGWDLPRCSCVILARPTHSRSLWKQMCGRALRPAPDLGKLDCLILDHAGCWKRHGFLTDPESYSLHGKEKRQSEAPMIACPQCGAEFPGLPRFCPECGHELPRHTRTAPAEESEGQLEELQPLDEMVDYYVSLAKSARDRGYQPVWVGLTFKKRYGCWPRPRHMGDDLHLATRTVEVAPGKWRRVWLKELDQTPSTPTRTGQ